MERVEGPVAPMSAFEWDAALATGHAEIDRQHQELFACSSRLLTAGPSAGPAFMELYESTRRHFDFEERLMRDIGYPHSFTHALLHSRLLGALNAVRQEIVAEGLGDERLRTFVYRWLVGHIVEHDRPVATAALAR
ncbi:MAG: hypothetical protein KGL18_04875 [Burkholderiales bacterium]|nr:hypothetical protein [Burkholderiales bacterium]MDE2502297.1 hypothetical protein [Burkholderiales bacterium]